MHRQGHQFSCHDLATVRGQAHADDGGLLLVHHRQEMARNHVGFKAVPTLNHTCACDIAAKQAANAGASEAELEGVTEVVAVDNDHVSQKRLKVRQLEFFSGGTSTFGAQHFPMAEQLAAAGVQNLAVACFGNGGVLQHVCHSLPDGLCQLETFDAKSAGAMPFDQTSSSPPATQPIFNVSPVVLAVVGLLVAVHLLFWALGESWQVWSLYAFSFIPARLGGGEAVPFPQGAQIWSFLTYALLHADVYHLGSNSIWLLIFSTPLARRLGAGRYLLLLAGSAIVGAAAVWALHYGEFLIVVGASGAVSAALAAAIPVMFAPGFRMGQSHRVDYGRLAVLQPGQLIRNRNAVGFALVFLVITLLTGASMAMTGTAYLEERNIAWEAHLGGFIAGIVLFYLLDKNHA